MALGDLMATRFAHSTVVLSNHLDECSNREYVELYQNRDLSETASTSGASGGAGVGNAYENAINMAMITSTAADSTTAATSMLYLPQTIVFCELRHEAFEDSVPTGPAESGLVSKWRPKDRVRLFWFIRLTLFMVLLV